MRGNRSELAPGRKSPRCHVNTPCVTLVYSCISKQERSYSATQSRLLGVRSRNEEAVYSTRNTIYSLKLFTSYFIDVDTFYLTVSELI